MTRESSGNTTTSSPRPYWVPPGVDLDKLPEQVRAAIVGIVNPAYQELVIGARDGLEKSAGVTVVSLLWHEILNQVQMGRELNNPSSLTQPSEELEQAIARHLRLVGAKVKASSFLLRVAEFREKYGRLPGAVPPWARRRDFPADAPEDARGE